MKLTSPGLKPTKIGLMGCGAVADYGHAPAIKATESLELYALYDPSESNLKKMQEKFGVPHAFTDMEEFFRSGIEAVAITSPAPCHRENVLDCARHRLPVMCEKPLAMNDGEAKEMVRAMSEANVSLHAGFCYRFSPSALKIRELVRAGAIGEVRSLRLIYNWNLAGKFVEGPDGKKTIQQRREGRMFEGGPMVDCGTHQIDLALFWLGSPVVHSSAHGAWVDEYEAPDHMWLHLDHADGAHTVVEISYSYGHTTRNRSVEFVYELIGTGGIIRYDREHKSFTLENEVGRQDFEYHSEKNFPEMYKEWGRVLHGAHSELLNTGEEGRIVAELARSATDSVIAYRNASSLPKIQPIPR